MVLCGALSALSVGMSTWCVCMCGMCFIHTLCVCVRTIVYGTTLLTIISLTICQFSADIGCKRLLYTLLKVCYVDIFNPKLEILLHNTYMSDIMFSKLSHLIIIILYN